MKISEAHKLYFQDKKLLGYSPYTLKAYNLQNKLLIRFLTDLDINIIIYENLKEYLFSQSHLKPASIV